MIFFKKKYFGLICYFFNNIFYVVFIGFGDCFIGFFRVFRAAFSGDFVYFGPY